MFRRKKLTLAFEGPQIRLMSIRGQEVERWEQAVLPERMIEGGVIKDSAAIGARLAELIEARDLPAKHVLCALSGHRAIFRTLSLPALEEDMIDEAIQRKVRQEIPMPQGEMDLTWSLLQRTEELLRAFVVAIPRSLIDVYIETLRSAGLTPKALDVAPLALIRSANTVDGIVADLEDHSLTVVIVRGRRPSIVRTVPVSGNGSSPEGHLELLIQELNRTTKFYNESHKEDPLPDSTVVTTTGAYFVKSAMVERFAARVPYPVAPPNPPLAYPLDFPLPQYSVNVGLALKDV